LTLWNAIEKSVLERKKVTSISIKIIKIEWPVQIKGLKDMAFLSSKNQFFNFFYILDFLL
jgi:hypothetical protein